MSGKNAVTGERAQGDESTDCGCAFVVDNPDGASGGAAFCQAPRISGSAYCPLHHAACHLPKGSAAEGRQLCEIEALAEAVGGRLGRPAPDPPDPLLRRLDRIAQAYSRLKCS